MRVLTIIATMFCFLISGCVSSNPVHPPKVVEKKIDILGDWLNSKALFIYNFKKEYSVSENASNMLWLEEAIRRGTESGYINDFQEGKWIREFYSKMIFQQKNISSLDNFKEQIREYAQENPPPLKKNITVDAAINASNNAKNGWKTGVQVELPKGVWQVKPVSGGWSAWPSDSALTPDISGAWTWNVFIKKPSIERSFMYGSNDWWQFSTAEKASDFAKNSLGYYTINMPNSGTVYFWIYDSGRTDDNRGYVTFEISHKE